MFEVAHQFSFDYDLVVQVVPWATSVVK